MIINLFECFGKLMFRNLFLVKQWHVPYFLYHLFAFHNSPSAKIESPFFVLVFVIFFSFLKVYLSRGLRFNRIRALFLNYSNFCQVSIAENVSTSFVNFVFSFSSEAVLQGLSKNNSTKNKSMPNSSGLEHAPAQKRTREKVF